jgi:Ala-tRNA(Pro) deacylase
MPAEKLRQLLDEHKIKYISINHWPAYTARETAASAFVPRGEFAKTIIVDLDGAKAMAIVPASRHVDTEALRKLAGADEARLATEDEFSSLFPDCEVGAMPPFGSLYGLPVYVDELVREVDDLCFNAGSHDRIIRMDCADFLELEQPVPGEFAVKE